MRRRSRIASGALAIAAVVVACGPPAGTLFRTTLSADDGSYSMPVTLGDQTGLVVAVDPGEGGELGTPEPSVVADPANARVLVVSWMGGACEDETVIGFWPDGDAFGMYVAPRGGPSLGGGCPAIGIFRAVRITLSAPIAAAQIRFVNAGS